MSKKERKEMLDGLKCSGTIFLAFFLWMTLSSFTFRPQVDVLAAYMEPVEPVEERAMPAPAALARDTRAVALSRVLYGYRWNSIECLKGVCWCIIGRCESPLYPDTVEEVCSQPDQWMGYSEGNPVIDVYYELALEVLEAWETGGSRNIPADCLWFTWNGNDSITFRTAFNGKYNTWTVE